MLGFLRNGVLLTGLVASSQALAQSIPTAPPTGWARIARAITPGQGLTADEVARRARATSYEMAAGKADVTAAEAVVDQAKWGYLPKLAAVARYTRLSDIGSPEIGTLVTAPGIEPGIIPKDATLIAAPLSFPVLLDSFVLQATLTIPVSDYFLRVPHAVAAAEQGAEASSRTLDATTHNVEQAAQAAFYMWVRARLSVGVAEAALETARGHLEDVRKAFQVGAASKADVLRVESSLAQAELAVLRATSAAELTEFRLRTAMHDAGTAPLTIGEDVLADLPEADEDLAVLTARALEHRPEFRALAAGIEATRDRGQLQRAGYLPRLDVVASANYSNPNPRVFPQKDEFRGGWDVTAQLSWTPTDIPGTRAQQRELDARVAQLEAQRAQLTDGVRVEVVAAWQDVRLARQAIETTTKALGTAEEAYRVRRALFQNGRATSLELTDAELELTRARLDAVNARIDLRMAKSSLARAVGH